MSFDPRVTSVERTHPIAGNSDRSVNRFQDLLIQSKVLRRSSTSQFLTVRVRKINRFPGWSANIRGKARRNRTRHMSCRRHWQTGHIRTRQYRADCSFRTWSPSSVAPTAANWSHPLQHSILPAYLSWYVPSYIAPTRREINLYSFHLASRGDSSLSCKKPSPPAL